MRKLNILLVIETGGAGSGRHVVDLASELVDRGHRVSVIYSELRAEPWFDTELAEVGNVAVYRQPMRRGPHLSDFGAIREVRGIIRKNGPFDIVHGHSSKAGAISRLAAWRTGCKSLYTPHALVTMNSKLPALNRFVYGSIERILAPVSDVIICVSSAEYDHAVSLGIAPGRLKIVPNGLRPLPDADRSSVRDELGLLPEHVAIGFVGRLEPQKAVDTLIHAFASFARTESNARLVIVGEGQEETELRRCAQEAGVSGQILWTGAANGPRMMAGFDIFALPSIFEAFPYVLIEAAFRGLPIVSTAVGGTAELVHDGYNGRVVPLGDVPAFAAALQELVHDDEIRERLGAASQELGKKFTVEEMATKTIEIYEELSVAR